MDILIIKTVQNYVYDYSHVLPPSIIEKSKKFRLQQDRNTFLAGRLLILEFLKITGSKYNLEHIKYGQYNKPFIPNFYHFNLSHAKEYIVLAYSSNQVGIDIEYNSNKPIDDLYDVLSIQEKQILEQSSIEKKSTAFFDIWTKKEAIVKAHGIGLNSRLHLINTFDNPAFFDGISFFTKKVNISKNYHCHISSIIELPTLNVKLFNVSDLL